MSGSIFCGEEGRPSSVRGEGRPSPVVVAPKSKAG